MEEERKRGRPPKLVADSSVPLGLRIAAAVQSYLNQGFALVDKGVTDDDAWIIRNAPHRIAECRSRLGAARLVSALYLGSKVGPESVKKHYHQHKESLKDSDGQPLTGWALHLLKRELIKEFNPQPFGERGHIGMADSMFPVPDTPRYRRGMAELKRNAPRIGKPRTGK